MRDFWNGFEKQAVSTKYITDRMIDRLRRHSGIKGKAVLLLTGAKQKAHSMAEDALQKELSKGVSRGQALKELIRGFNLGAPSTTNLRQQARQIKALKGQ